MNFAKRINIKAQILSLFIIWLGMFIGEYAVSLLQPYIMSFENTGFKTETSEPIIVYDHLSVVMVSILKLCAQFMAYFTGAYVVASISLGQASYNVKILFVLFSSFTLIRMLPALMNMPDKSNIAFLPLGFIVPAIAFFCAYKLWLRKSHKKNRPQ